MLFINTRPQDRAATLTDTLQYAGIQVLEIPLLELQARAWSADLAQCYAQLLNAQVIVVVSPSAVTMGMAWLDRAGLTIAQLESIQWVAVGQATANTLAQYGIRAITPSVETSEGMLTLPCLEHLVAGSTVAFWRGEGGRQFMMQQLIERDIDILNFILYERQLPLLSAQSTQSYVSVLQASPRYCMLVTSEASWLNWLQLMQDHHDLLKRACFLVLGERLVDVVTQSRAQLALDYQMIQLEDLNPTHILQYVQQVQETP